MIADLKARAAAFDKKRIFTAAATLVIAGAAGHVMQRGASTPESTPVLTASVPGTPAAVASLAPVAPALKLRATTEPQPERFVAAAPQISVIAPIADTKSVGIALANSEASLAYPESARLDDISEAPTLVPDGSEPSATSHDEVTRSAAEPILAFTEAPSMVGEYPAATEPFKLAAADQSINLVAEPDPVLANCDITLDAKAQPGALVALTLSAPCNAGGKVSFDHSGLAFSDQLGPEGELFLIVPAMAADAIIIARLDGGESQSVAVTLPDFGDYERVALMWKGATGLQLHALENGAGYGEPGHVWAEAPAMPEAATTGSGGFLSVLGSTAEGYAADVYTYPTGLIRQGAEPQVSIEAQVMENTCGSRIEGSVLRTNMGRAPTTEPLAMAVPGCDAVGEYLVLNILPQDLTLARN